MSCEIRSITTSYFFGSSMRMPPIFTNSAVTPSTFIELIFSTTAGGNEFSMPNTMPIFFTTHSPFEMSSSAKPKRFLNSTGGRRLTTNDRRLEVLSRHPQPQRPVVPGVIVPHVQPVGNCLRVQNRGKLDVLIQAHVPIRRPEHDLHLPIAAQEPVIAQVRQKIRRTIVVAIVVIIPIQKLMNIVRPAHADAMCDHVGMLQRKVHRVISAKTAPRHG